MRGLVLTGVITSCAVVTQVGKVINLRDIKGAVFGHFLKDRTKAFGVPTGITDIKRALGFVSDLREGDCLHYRIAF